MSEPGKTTELYNSTTAVHNPTTGSSTPVSSAFLLPLTFLFLCSSLSLILPFLDNFAYLLFYVFLFPGLELCNGVFIRPSSAENLSGWTSFILLLAGKLRHNNICTLYVQHPEYNLQYAIYATFM